MKLLAALMAIPMLLGFGDSAQKDEILNNKRTVTNSPPPVFKLTEDTNIVTAYKFLTGPGIFEASHGRLKPMTPESAAGLIGSWVVETGSQELTNLDVVEYNGGAGRGMSQYTGVRRWPYDKARMAQLNSGGDPNCIDFQLNYFVEEYIGMHDYNGSLIGWTFSLERFSFMRNPELAAEAFTRHYFRPSRPHYSRRRYEARRIYELVKHITINEPNT